MKNKINIAMKWSLFTEMIVKIISPITNMILARLLVPSDFGIVASLMIITSFSEMISDAGFQKFLIQYQFKDDNELLDYASVAFWTNFILSIIIYILIFLFSTELSNMVGLTNHSNTIRIYSLIILLIPLSSINYTLFKKKYEYKSLGLIRIIFKLMPLIITIPLSYLGFSYWSLVIGNLLGELANSLFSFYISKYKIKKYFSFICLKNMYKFCLTATLESISSWLISNISILIVGYYFGTYLLGIYKVSITTVNQIISIITAATMSIIFTQLSDFQKDNNLFNDTILYYQRKIGFFTIPMGVLIFLYRKTIVLILLGNNWLEASNLIGLWGFILCESVIFADIGVAATISKGKPLYIFYSNIIQVLILAIFFILNKNIDFDSLILYICIIRLQLTVTHFLSTKKVSNISLKLVFFNVLPYIVSTTIVYLIYIVFNNYFVNFYLIKYIILLPLGFMYILMLLLIPSSRNEIINIFTREREYKL